jgi:hypothetical protein
VAGATSAQFSGTIPDAPITLGAGEDRATFLQLALEMRG